MKIKQIEYKKLFNLSNYEHEEIGITADIYHSYQETPEKALAQLVETTETMHKAIQILQRMYAKIDRYYASWDDPWQCSLPCESICYKEERIKSIKRLIKKLQEKIKIETDDEEKQFCRKQLIEYKDQLKKDQEDLKETQKQAKQLLSQYRKLKSAFKDGDFSFVDNSGKERKKDGNNK